MNLPSITKLSSIAVVSAGLFGSASAAVIIGAAPTTDLLYTDLAAGINSNMIDEVSNPGNHGRADTFTLATSSTGTFDITAVTLAKNGNQTFNADTMNVFIATGGATDWDNGTGHNTADDGTNYLVDTGMTLQIQEAFPLTGAVTGTQFVTFEFASPVTLDDNTEYTVGFVFNEGSGPDRFGYDETPDGGRLSVTTAAYGGPSGSRGISFAVIGTESIPEPSSAILLGLGGLALLRRRR